MLNCVHRIELADIRELCADTKLLQTFVADVVADVDKVANEVSRRYLVHAGDLRQVTDE
jgi:hypothetical protein